MKKIQNDQQDLNEFITDQVDYALRGVRSYEYLNVSNSHWSHTEIQASIYRHTLRYNLDQSKSISRVETNEFYPSKNILLRPEDGGKNLVLYKKFLIREIQAITEEQREIHQLILVEQKPLVEHILGHIISKIHYCSEDTVYRKNSDDNHSTSCEKWRERVFQKLLDDKSHVRAIEKRLVRYFQPAEYHKVRPKEGHLTADLINNNLNESWIGKKRKTGQKNHKKAQIHLWHSALQPFALTMIILSTSFSRLWHITLASYLACIVFFIPKPLEPLKLLGKQLSQDRIKACLLVFLIAGVSSWLLFQYIPGITTLVSIKITTCIGLLYLACSKVTKSTQEVVTSNYSKSYKLGILGAEYLLNLTIIASIIASFLNPHYIIINEVLVAWYSVDMCIGSINLLPSLSDKKASRLIWSSLSLTALVFIGAFLLSKITLLEMYIGITGSFAILTRIISTQRVIPELNETCARHTSYLWLCWLTLENRLHMYPTLIALYVCLITEVGASIYDWIKNCEWHRVLSFKTQNIDDAIQGIEKYRSRRSSQATRSIELQNTRVTDDSDSDYSELSDDEFVEIDLGSPIRYNNS